MSTCELCGASPAAPIKLKRNVGLVLVHRTWTAKAVLCAECAERATREFQRETLKKGWTSPRSALFNPATMAGNAIRKKRHERQLRSLGGAANDSTSRSTSSSTDPSTLLLVLSALDAANSALLQRFVLDYQGGGITSSGESVSLAQRTPDARLQSEMVDIAKTIVEGMAAGGHSDQGQGIMHGILVTSLWEALSMTGVEDVRDVHRAVSGATIAAAASLVRSGATDDAFKVAILGQVLYANATDWSASL